VVTAGLGRGGPAFVDDETGPWLTWVGAREELWLLPLDPSGAPSGPPSVEEALDDARPLVSTSPDGRLLVATPSDRAAPLRTFACRR
jgi:hypothetical protein